MHRHPCLIAAPPPPQTQTQPAGPLRIRVLPKMYSIGIYYAVRQASVPTGAVLRVYRHIDYYQVSDKQVLPIQYMAAVV
jgi:hypothetical protein